VTITINTEDRRPLYLQVADGIRTLIAGGQLRQGQSLPPVRQLAADLGVNLNTIAAAYRELQNDGLIAIRHGTGATVGGRSAVKVSEADLRRPLRNALTQMVLSGMPRGQILSLVNDELRGLLKGAKS
jgi:GntR family transcriptional regulator